MVVSLDLNNPDAPFHEARNYYNRRALRATFALVIVTVAVIFWNSLQDGTASSHFSSTVGRLVYPVIKSLQFAAMGVLQWTNWEGITNYDLFVRKLGHFTEFSILGAELSVLAMLYAKRTRSALTWMPFCLSLLTAVTDEYIQGRWSTGRSSEVTDVWVDFTAASIAIVVTMWVKNLLVSIELTRPEKWGIETYPGWGKAHRRRRRVLRSFGVSPDGIQPSATTPPAETQQGPDTHS